MKGNSNQIPPQSQISNGDTLTRRNFIQMGGVVAGGLMLSPAVATANFKNWSKESINSQWYHKPVRIMHTVLREIDARNYDSGKVVDYLKKGGYNTLCVNAGGIVD
uniref:twin-arginine translocation signal domain-containing protein n=1 Tax=Aquiflexum sp. TaxID=1872584 RepID=UPI0035936785